MEVITPRKTVCYKAGLAIGTPSKLAFDKINNPSVTPAKLRKSLAFVSYPSATPSKQSQIPNQQQDDQKYIDALQKLIIPTEVISSSIIPSTPLKTAISSAKTPAKTTEALISSTQPISTPAKTVQTSIADKYATPAKKQVEELRTPAREAPVTPVKPAITPLPASVTPRRAAAASSAPVATPAPTATATPATTTPKNPMDKTFFDDEYEFNAPKFFDFGNIGHVMDESRMSGWFSTEEAKVLEHLDDTNYNNSGNDNSFSVNYEPLYKEEPTALDQTSEFIISSTPLKKSGYTKAIPFSPKFQTFLETKKPGIKKNKNLMAKKKLSIARKHGHANMPAPSTKQGLRITRPQPFKLRTALRVKDCHHWVQASTNAVVSPDHKPLMERVREIENELPSRFKPRPDPVPESLQKPLTLTLPQEIHLHTMDRVRPNEVVKTTEEIELENLAKQPKFKARPFRKSIFEHEIGIPKVEKKPPTEFEEFHLTTKRKREDDLHEFSEDQQPHKKQRLNEEVQHHEPEVLHPTIPKSPFLNTKIRMAHKTEQRMEQLLSQQQQVPTFKARPLPVGSPFKVKHADIVPTAPKTPNLQTEKRGKVHQEVFHHKLQEKENTIKQQREFKAKPIYFEPIPILPKVEKKPIEPPAELHLASDVRAATRKEFDEKLRIKQQQLEEEKKKQEEERKRREEEEVKQLRKEIDAKMKARPLPAFYAKRKQPSGTASVRGKADPVGTYTKKLTHVR